jgi:hypothetical protein
MLVSGFEDADMIPPLICFMGNFTSHPCSSNPGEDFASLRDGFTSLARLIESYPKIKVRFESCGESAASLQILQLHLNKQVALVEVRHCSTPFGDCCTRRSLLIVLLLLTTQGCTSCDRRSNETA